MMRKRSFKVFSAKAKRSGPPCIVQGKRISEQFEVLGLRGCFPSSRQITYTRNDRVSKNARELRIQKRQNKRNKTKQTNQK